MQKAQISAVEHDRLVKVVVTRVEKSSSRLEHPNQARSDPYCELNIVVYRNRMSATSRQTMFVRATMLL